MNRFAAAALRITRTLVRLLASPLPSNLKRKLLKDYLLSIEFKRYGTRGAPLKLAGYTVRYLGFGGLVFQFHELFAEAQYLVPLSTADPFIIDCGSNLGLSVMFFARLFPTARILAFEPDPQAYDCLVQNLQANGLEQVTAERVAVTDHDGEVDFYADPMRPGSALGSTIPGRKGEDVQRVPSRRLSSYINQRVDLLKLDIEGAELSVLRELSQAQRLAHIENCLIEYHHHIHPGQDRLSELLSLLEASEFGYMISVPRYPGHIREKYQDLLIYAYRKS
jgi:FkbM family methyltransferase